MKLSKAIHGCDDNSNYTEFWPIVAEAWQRLDVEPILFFTGSNKSIIDTSYGRVIFCDEIGINPTFHAQTIRLLAPSLFPHDCCIITDLDMLPLSHEYFQGNIEQCANDKFVHYNIGVPYEKDQLYMAYNAALGKTWGNVFKVEGWDEINATLKSWWNPWFYATSAQRNKSRLYRRLGIKNGWYTDQRMLKKYINDWEEKEEKFIMLTKHKKVHCVLNRSKLPWLNRSNASEMPSVKFQPKDALKYTCFHMPRPFSGYEKYINHVYNTTSASKLPI